jgi:hypothetical protein
MAFPDELFFESVWRPIVPLEIAHTRAANYQKSSDAEWIPD